MAAAAAARAANSADNWSAKKVAADAAKAASAAPRPSPATARRPRKVGRGMAPTKLPTKLAAPAEANKHDAGDSTVFKRRPRVVGSVDE